MRTPNSSPEVAVWLDRLDHTSRTAVAALREFILGAAPDIHELVYHDALGYSTSRSSFDRILYIARSGDHVNLGFFFGSSLDDPGHLLRGAGKRMRHIKIVSEENARNPGVQELLQQALEDGLGQVRRLHGPRRAP